MMDITVLMTGIAACAVIFATTLVHDEKTEFARLRAFGRMINRFGGAPIAGPIAAAFAVLLINDRWWLLLTLNTACYACTAPFMASAPLRLVTAICGTNTVVLIALGLTR